VKLKLDGWQWARGGYDICSRTSGTARQGCLMADPGGLDGFDIFTHGYWPIVPPALLM